MCLSSSQKVSKIFVYASYESVADHTRYMLVVATRKGIAELGKSSYIAVSTGFWYEWGLAVPVAFGIDFANRTVTLFDEGETKISMSTLPQVRPQPSVSFLTSD